MAELAKDLGISESCLRNWVARDDIDAGRKEGLTSDERRELVELRRELRVARLKGAPVADTSAAVLMWEPVRVVPSYAVPEKDVTGDVAARHSSG